MFFLLRMAFWLGVVCVLLPGGSQPSVPEAQINATEAVTLASAAVSDVRGFCDRQPDACLVGGKVATVLGHKAEAGARTIYEFVTATLNDSSTSTNKLAETTTAPATTTGSTTPVKTVRAVPVSTRDLGTLKPADLQPAWHAPVPLPQPRREARTSRPSA